MSLSYEMRFKLGRCMQMVTRILLAFAEEMQRGTREHETAVACSLDTVSYYCFSCCRAISERDRV